MKHAIEQIAIYVSRMSGIRWTDIVEIIILSFLIYHILVWIKNTKAWSLLKGILVIAVFILFAAYFEMNTILWIVNNLFSVAVTAVVVILQPELRRAVEELGRKNIISSIIPITVGLSESLSISVQPVSIKPSTIRVNLQIIIRRCPT